MTAHDVVWHLPELLRFGPSGAGAVDRREGEAGVVDENVQAGEALRCGENSVAFGGNAQILDEGKTRPSNSRRRLPLRGFAAMSGSVLCTLPKVVNQARPHSPDNSVIFEQQPTLGFSRLCPAR
jgi:hypothetical protein